MLGSVAGYFFSVITVFAGVMTFMTLLIGVFDNSAFEKLRHYPRPISLPLQTSAAIISGS